MYGQEKRGGPEEETRIRKKGTNQKKGTDQKERGEPEEKTRTRKKSEPEKI